jgi:hypothetical protein
LQHEELESSAKRRKELKEEMEAKYKETKDKLEKRLETASNISLIVFSCLVMVSSYFYLLRWLHKDDFDNKYLTAEFERMDGLKALKDEELQPLGPLESLRYIEPNSIRLVDEDWMEFLSEAKTILLWTAGAFAVIGL